MRTDLILRAAVAALLVAAIASPLALAATKTQLLVLHDPGSNPSSGFTTLHIAPDALTVNAGDTLELTVGNAGTEVHTFHIDGYNKDTGAIQPNASAKLSFIAANAGDFDYYCTIPGHKEAGMAGVLHVQSTAAGGSKTPGLGLMATLAAGLAVAVAYRVKRR